jgi:hypothetical protein
MGRRPIGRKAMTPKQRSARHRAKLRPDRTALKQERRRVRESELAAATVRASLSVGSKLYGVIYADPPWRFEPRSRETGMDRAADNHYPTMTLDDIKAIMVPAAKVCVLFLWATAPMLSAALAVMEAWGFTYKTHWVWVKTRAVTGTGTATITSCSELPDLERSKQQLARRQQRSCLLCRQ